MKKILLILITLTSFIPIITKRNDYIDVTKVIYINSICLDINEDNNQYDCYFYVLNNFNLAQAEISSNNVDNLAYVAKITAPTLTEAFRKLNQISNIYIHYNHLRTVILTNKFLNNPYKHYGLVLRLIRTVHIIKLKDYENVGTSSDNTHGNVHLEKGETKTITLYYLITDEEFARY